MDDNESSVSKNQTEIHVEFLEERLEEVLKK